MNGQQENNTVGMAIHLPGLTVAEIAPLLQNPEHLLRLNPFLEIRSWEQLPHPRAVIWRLQAFNEMNGLLSDRTVWIRQPDGDCGYALEYREGIKELTRITWRGEGDHDAVVEIQERYRLGKDGPLQEVDPSLSLWITSIRRYLLGWKKWGRFTLYRWFQYRYWLTMTPGQRRLVVWTLWATLLELVVTTLLFVYWLI